MKDIILPGIKMITSIREELRQDPIYWALALSNVQVILTKYSSNVEIGRQWEEEDYNSMVCLMFGIKDGTNEINILASSIEDNTGLYIQVHHLQDYYYFKVEKNSLFKSLDILTEESLKNDLGLVKLIENVTDETLKKFGIEKQVEYRLFPRKRKVEVDPLALKLYNSLFD